MSAAFPFIFVLKETAEVVVPIVFGVVSTGAGMGPAFWLDAGMPAFGGWLMHRDADGRDRSETRPS